jgi:hypothetical protein
MQQLHAEPILAAIAAALGFIAILANSGIKFDGPELRHVLATRWRFLFAFCLIFAVGGWWTANTWRKLWRQGRSRWERLVYDYGVRGGGFATGVTLVAIVAWLGWSEDAGPLFGPMMIAGGLAGLFFGMPVSLHMGYFWGISYAKTMGVERDPSEVGAPPRLA